MDYKIIEKEAFTVLGKARRFDFDCAFNEIPKFWGEHMQSADKKCVVYTGFALKMKKMKDLNI